MNATLRSVVPAGVVLAVVAVAALLVTRATAQPPSPPRPWTPPAGFIEVASVQPGDETRVSLWLGRVGPPKPDGCWYLVRRSADGDLAVGGCGGVPGQPWVVRLFGVVAGATGEEVARWVRVGSGTPIAVTQGHFIAVGSLSGPFHVGRTAR
jgi:hypothetical protein